MKPKNAQYERHPQFGLCVPFGRLHEWAKTLPKPECLASRECVGQAGVSDDRTVYRFPTREAAADACRKSDTGIYGRQSDRLSLVIRD